MKRHLDIPAEFQPTLYGDRMDVAQRSKDCNRVAPLTVEAILAREGAMADIFISYSQQDREWVKELATALESESFSVWWDPKILPGARYRELTGKELEAARAVVVVWSRLSITSDWVIGEADEARLANKLVPVLKEPVRPPTEFRGIQTADLSQWLGQREHPAFISLIKAIRALAGGASPRDAGASDTSVEAPAGSPAPETAQQGGSRWSRWLGGLILTLFLVGAIGVAVLGLLSTDEWPPTFAGHLNEALAQADSQAASAVANQKAALSAENEIKTQTGAVVAQAQEAEKLAQDAAAKAKAGNAGYAVFENKGDVTDMNRSWRYAGQIVRVHGAPVAAGYGVKSYDDSGGAEYKGQLKGNQPDGFGTLRMEFRTTYARWKQSAVTGYFQTVNSVTFLALEQYWTCIVKLDPDRINALGFCTAEDRSSHFAGEIFASPSPEGEPQASPYSGVFSASQGRGTTVAKFGEALYQVSGIIDYPDGTRWKGAQICANAADVRGCAVYGARYSRSGSEVERGRYSDDGMTLEKSYVFGR